MVWPAETASTIIGLNNVTIQILNLFIWKITELNVSVIKNNNNNYKKNIFVYIYIYVFCARIDLHWYLMGASLKAQIISKHMHVAKVE